MEVIQRLLRLEEIGGREARTRRDLAAQVQLCPGHQVAHTRIETADGRERTRPTGYLGRPATWLAGQRGLAVVPLSNGVELLGHEAGLAKTQRVDDALPHELAVVLTAESCDDFTEERVTEVRVLKRA